MTAQLSVFDTPLLQTSCGSFSTSTRASSDIVDSSSGERKKKMPKFEFTPFIPSSVAASSEKIKKAGQLGQSDGATKASARGNTSKAGTYSKEEQISRSHLKEEMKLLGRKSMLHPDDLSIRQRLEQIRLLFNVPPKALVKTCTNAPPRSVSGRSVSKDLRIRNGLVSQSSSRSTNFPLARSSSSGPSVVTESGNRKPDKTAAKGLCPSESHRKYYDEDDGLDDFIVDDEEVDSSWQRELRNTTGYDPRDFDAVDADEIQEVSFHDSVLEDKRTAIIGAREDAIEWEREQEEERQRRKRSHKK